MSNYFQVMSHEHRKETVMESTKRGSCNFLVKPVSKEIISVLWQHVYRKKISVYSAESDPGENVGLDQDLYQTNKEDSSSGEQNSSYQKENKSKKPRMTWTSELHQLFEKAVEKMGGLERNHSHKTLVNIQLFCMLISYYLMF